MNVRDFEFGSGFGGLAESPIREEGNEAHASN
jgi:hypothetical protein